MRVLFALLLLLPLAAAATPESFVQPYLQPGEFAYSRHADYSNHTYYIVWVNATETFVLAEPSSGVFSFVNDTSLIYGVLLRDFLTQLDMSADMSSLNQKLAAFNASRQPRQGNCEVTTGTDHLPCYDAETCLQACFSVPACRDNNQGSGGEFVTEMLKWRNNNSMLDANLSLYSQQLENVAVKSEQLHVEVSTAESQLARIFPPVDAIRTNRLFTECPTCFFYCHPIPFNTTALNSSSAEFASIRAKLVPMSQLNARSEGIRHLTFVRTEGSAFIIMVNNMTTAYNGISARMRALLPLRDAALDYNLTRLNSTLQMVLANGSAKNYEDAFALEPGFYSIAFPMDLRITELKALKDEYDAMRAQVSSMFLNATANANTALSQINDSRLSDSIGRMRNITGRMDALANESKMREALELKNEFDYEAANANSMIINITITYSSVAQAKEAGAQRLADISQKLRPNYASFRAEYENLSARFSAASQLASTPMQPEDVAPAKAEFASIAQASSGLSARLDAQIKKDDWAAMKGQLFLIFKLIFFHKG